MEVNRPITRNTAISNHVTGPTEIFNPTLKTDTNHPRADSHKTFLHQKNASPDLALVSWPRTNDPIPKGGSRDGYWYNVLNGVDKFIYVIEEGVEPNHPDFRAEPWKPPMEWLWTPGVSQTKDDNDRIYHGSCVASKAVGWIHGVSKNSRLVIVKASHDLVDNEWAFAAAYDDILQKGRIHKSVVLYARTSDTIYTVDSELPPHWAGIKDLVTDMLASGIIVVAGAGNEGKDYDHVNTVPAIWGESLPLIVVGAVSVVGKIASISQSLFNDERNIWAPGENANCATGLAGEQTVSGTSVSAGMVAGLVAYLFQDFEAHTGTIPTPAAMRDYILILSRPIRTRRPYSSTPKVIYNGALPSDHAALSLPTNGTGDTQID